MDSESCLESDTLGNVFSELLGITDMTLCRIDDSSNRLNQRLHRERQLRLYGHAARYPEVDPADLLFL